MESQNAAQLQKQIEFYMSDENLKNDKFFNNLIRQAPNKEIPIKILLNCRKIQALNANEENITNAIKNSNELLISENFPLLFKRVNRHVPILREKKFYITFNEDYKMTDEEKELEDNFILFTPMMIEFFGNKKLFYKGRDLEKKLKKLWGIDVPYIKISRKKGYIVFNKLKIEDMKKLEEVLEKDNLEIDNYILELRKMDEGGVRQWINLNRSNLELGLKIKYHASIKKEKKADFGKRPFLDEDYGPFTLKEKEFRTVRDLKYFLKNIVAMTKNGSEIEGEKFDVCKEVFGYHPDKSKVQNIVKIMVDVNPTYKTTRCFLLGDGEGKWEDISFHKCLSTMCQEMKNKDKK